MSGAISSSRPQPSTQRPKRAASDNPASAKRARHSNNSVNNYGLKAEAKEDQISDMELEQSASSTGSSSTYSEDDRPGLFSASQPPLNSNSSRDNKETKLEKDPIVEKLLEKYKEGAEPFKEYLNTLLNEKKLTIDHLADTSISEYNWPLLYELSLDDYTNILERIIDEQPHLIVNTLIILKNNYELANIIKELLINKNNVLILKLISIHHIEDIDPKLLEDDIQTEGTTFLMEIVLQKYWDIFQIFLTKNMITSHSLRIKINDKVFSLVAYPHTNIIIYRGISPLWVIAANEQDEIFEDLIASRLLKQKHLDAKAENTIPSNQEYSQYSKMSVLAILCQNQKIKIINSLLNNNLINLSSENLKILYSLAKKISNSETNSPNEVKINRRFLTLLSENTFKLIYTKLKYVNFLLKYHLIDLKNNQNLELLKATLKEALELKNTSHNTSEKDRSRALNFLILLATEMKGQHPENYTELLKALFNVDSHPNAWTIISAQLKALEGINNPDVEKELLSFMLSQSQSQ